MDAGNKRLAAQSDKLQISVYISRWGRASAQSGDSAATAGQQGAQTQGLPRALAKSFQTPRLGNCRSTGCCPNVGSCQTHKHAKHRHDSHHATRHARAATEWHGRDYKRCAQYARTQPLPSTHFSASNPDTELGKLPLIMLYSRLRVLRSRVQRGAVQKPLPKVVATVACHWPTGGPHARHRNQSSNNENPQHTATHTHTSQDTYSRTGNPDTTLGKLPLIPPSYSVKFLRERTKAVGTARA